MPRLNPNERAALARLAPVLREQERVITAADASAAGLTAGIVRERVASGVWQRLHRGVFFADSSEPSLGARMWGAHLATDRLGVICGRAGGHAWGLLDGPFDSGSPIVLFVPEGHQRITTGLISRRVTDPLAWAHPARQPLILSVEHSVLDLVRLARTDAEAADVVLRACRLRLTTPDRIAAAMAGRARVARRQLIKAMCAEVRSGVQSPLELEYRRRVARPHGLPIGQAQMRAVDAGGVVYRDLLIEPYGLIVELDGRLGHEGESAALRDQRRDNHATLSGKATLHYGWHAVMGNACDVATQVDLLLRMGGWPGSARACGPSCPLRAQLRAA